MSTSIVSYKDYVAGWLDYSLHDFVEILSPPVSTIKYALITCLDSNPNPASLRDKSPELKLLANKVEAVKTGLLLPTKLLLKTIASQQLFFGFDEVWFFPTKRIQPKPSSVFLVGPARLSQARLEKLGEWMADNECYLGLGGGEGLNFVVRAHGLAKFLLGSTIEPPEAAQVSA